MINYTVNAGDTLSAIARHFGVSIANIANANGIEDVDVIYTGQVLSIPGSAAEELTPAVVTVQHAAPYQPVRRSGVATPIANTGGPMFNIQDWLRPPKLYYTLAALAVGAFLFNKKRR